MKKEALSPVQQVRKTSGTLADNRRNIAILNIVGLLDFIPVSLFQTGLVNHLPDLPGKIFDAEYVNSSEDAQIAGFPDGPVSLMMYASSLALAGAALKTGKRKNLFDYLIAAVSVGQAVGGAYYLKQMATVEKKVCIYCVAGALINFATLVPVYKLFFRK